ncbi:MAG: UDP-4-amino-4,6-dideoxy-N-acetyl-beta-L-altrosamine transaminase [Cyclobacteriaceae bacterium]
MNSKAIPYGRQNITDEDIEEVVAVLKGDFLTQGPKIKEFEESFAEYIGSSYAVAVANGTAALHLCALALDVGKSSKIITTPISFAATANCIKFCEGEVMFCDIDPNTFLLDIEKVRELLTKSPRGTYSGIIPVDFAGRAVDMEAFRNLADEYGCWIIEDACHAPGGYFIDQYGNDQKCGNGKFVDLAIFSFHPVKHIASGEGGMITTNDKALYERLLTLRSHGITRDESLFRNSIDFAASGQSSKGANYPGWYMEMQELGFNYRLTDFQAALGLSQLKRAEEGLRKRRAIAKVYDEAFESHSFIQSQLNELKGTHSGHAYHLYIIKVPNRLDLYNYLRENNIFTQVHYIPTHLMPYYQNLGWKEGDLTASEDYYRSCLSLPMYPTLTEQEQKYVIDKINAFYS